MLYAPSTYNLPHPEANRRKYGAKELLTEGGLNEYDFEARRLTPLASFSQPDPLAFLKSEYSPYSYCHADPVNFIDPTGLFDTRKEAEEWAKENGIRTGFLRDHKIQQQEDGTWAVVNTKENLLYSRDHSLDGIEGVAGRRADGVTQSVIVYPNESGATAITLSDVWNSQFARQIVPDIVSMGVGYSGIFGVGSATSVELSWITRGPESSFWPILSVSESVGTGFSVDATVNFGYSNYCGPVSNINRDIISTSIAKGNFGGFLSGSLSDIGNIGGALTWTTFEEYLLLSGQINVRIGAPMGPVPVNGAGGVYNTYVLKDFAK